MRHFPLLSQISTAILGLLAFSVVLGIVTFPNEAFRASLQALSIWWDIVFPALLPYFILSEIMLAQGIVHLLGTWLDPLMRTLFRLPGISGWAIAVGLTAGTPAGAEMTARLRKERHVSRSEGETLLALSCLFSPIFIIVVLAVGFWNEAGLALFILVVHYASALIIGWLWVLGLRRKSPHPSWVTSTLKPMRNSLLKRSFQAMQQAKREDGRSLGRLLGDSVTHSIQALMLIGGLMMIFSMIIKLMELIIWPDHWTIWLAPFLEIHVGAYALADTGLSIWTMSLLSAALGFSGLSIHSQVKSFIHGTDLRYRSFFVMKVFHGLLAFGLAFIAWNPFQYGWIRSQTAFDTLGSEHLDTFQATWLSFYPTVGFILLLALILVMLAVSFLIGLYHRQY